MLGDTYLTKSQPTYSLVGHDAAIHTLFGSTRLEVAIEQVRRYWQIMLAVRAKQLLRQFVQN